MRLAGSTAIVTGSDSGAIAGELAGLGADVCVTFHTDEAGANDADYVTGASFFIDGGLRMMMGQDA